MNLRYHITSILLAVAMAFNVLPPTSSAAEGTGNFKRVNTYQSGMFTDVPSEAWYASGVRSAYELGLMKGSDGAFSSNGPVKLSEAITMAARLHSIYYNGSENFQQTSPWYSVYVDYAKRVGILTQDYLDYNVATTRIQFATIFAHALPASALHSINNIADGAIPDVNVSTANAQEVYSLYRAGVLTGSDDKLTFHPSSSVLRSEAAAIATRMALPEQRVTIKTNIQPTHTWQGDPSLDFTAQLSTGESFTLSKQAGKVVVVNFWATFTWGVTGEPSVFSRLYSEYDTDEVKMIFINCGEDPKTVQSFLDGVGCTLPVICDTNDTISSAYASTYGATLIPRTVIFGKDGTISVDYLGLRNYQIVKSLIDSALEGRTD